jgi:hypothetical protein
MKPFKFLTNNKRIYFEGWELTFVGYRMYDPTTFDLTITIRLRDEGGRIHHKLIDETHPLWNELIDMEGYCI